MQRYATMFTGTGEAMGMITRAAHRTIAPPACFGSRALHWLRLRRQNM